MAMSIWRRKRRKKLWEMNKVCFVCQKIIDHFHEATLEHVIPKSLGGSYKLRNLALSHIECNQLRGPIRCRIVWELKQTTEPRSKFLDKNSSEIEKAWYEKVDATF